MGCLLWSEAEAMWADPLSIVLAARAFNRNQDNLFRAIYGANGAKLPPAEVDEDETPRPSNLANRFKLMARQHNERFAERRRRPGVGGTGVHTRRPDSGQL